jgi:hypothetical protein
MNRSGVGGVHPDLAAAISKALVPTWQEVVRAKKRILEIVSKGRVHGVRTLQECLCVADGVPVDVDRGDELHVPPADDMQIAIQAAVTKDRPLLARNRLVLAASEALVDLAAQGILVEVARALDNASGNPLIRDNRVSILCHMSGYRRLSRGPWKLRWGPPCGAARVRRSARPPSL